MSDLSNNSAHEKFPKIKALVLDMDGLMVNTEDLYDQVGQQLLERRNKTFTLDLKRQMMGLPANEAFQFMRAYHGLDDSVDQLHVESKQIFSEMLPGQLELIDGVLELLDFARQNSIPMAVATSSTREFAHTVIGHFDLVPRFEFILTSEDVVNGKPHPDIYLRASELLDFDVAEMLVLEDSVIGSRAAAAAGAFTVAIPGKHNVGQDFSHSSLVVDNIRDPIIYRLLKPID